jgi:hypothetical protein
MNMEGRVDKIWENESNGKLYWVLQIDGERYATWNRKHLEDLKEGSLVVYEYKQSGKYRNITSLAPVNAPDDEEKPVYRSKFTDPYERDLRMVRMSALRSATQLIYNEQMDWDQKVASTFELAREFEHYVVGKEPSELSAQRSPKYEEQPGPRDSRPTPPSAGPRQQRPQSR